LPRIRREPASDPLAVSSQHVSTQPPDPRAEADPLRTQVYDALRSIARGQLARMAPGQTLQATALVHEAWLKLSAQDQQLPRATFAAAAARAMRDILIDRVRARLSQKRGGGRLQQDVHENEPEVVPALPVADLMSLDTALQELQQEHPEAAELVLRRFFAGDTMAEIAAERGVDERTVYRSWRFARAFLVQRLGDGFLPEGA
jgi:RNA polymerase sigma factor (TIGR02999 family)